MPDLGGLWFQDSFGCGVCVEKIKIDEMAAELHLHPHSEVDELPDVDVRRVLVCKRQVNCKGGCAIIFFWNFIILYFSIPTFEFSL